jgi:hypothetical protein
MGFLYGWQSVRACRDSSGITDHTDRTDRRRWWDHSASCTSRAWGLGTVKGAGPVTAARERLPNRRASEQIAFTCGGFKFIATISRFFDGRLAEIFLTNAESAALIATYRRVTLPSLFRSRCSTAFPWKCFARRSYARAKARPADRSASCSTLWLAKQDSDGPALSRSLPPRRIRSWP